MSNPDKVCLSLTILPRSQCPAGRGGTGAVDHADVPEPAADPHPRHQYRRRERRQQGQPQVGAGRAGGNDRGGASGGFGPARTGVRSGTRISTRICPRTHVRERPRGQRGFARASHPHRRPRQEAGRRHREL